MNLLGTAEGFPTVSVKLADDVSRRPLNVSPVLVMMLYVLNVALPSTLPTKVEFSPKFIVVPVVLPTTHHTSHAGGKFVILTTLWAEVVNEPSMRNTVGKPATGH